MFLFSNFFIQPNSSLKPSHSFYHTCTHQELKTGFNALNQHYLNDHIRSILLDMCAPYIVLKVLQPQQTDVMIIYVKQKYYVCQFQDATSFRIFYSSGIFAETALYVVIIIINKKFCTYQLAKTVLPHSAESKNEASFHF